MDRNGVTADVNDGIASEKRQLHRIVDPTIGAYGIPNPTELNAHCLAMGKLPFESFIGGKGFPLVPGFPRGSRIHLKDIRNGLLVSCTQDAVHMDQTGQHPDCEGSTAE